MYTQCPACNTVFRVRKEHLRPARGKVRCGRCMTVFNAARHRIARLPADTVTTKSDTPGSASANARPRKSSAPADKAPAENATAQSFPSPSAAALSNVDLEAPKETKTPERRGAKKAVGKGEEVAGEPAIRDKGHSRAAGPRPTATNAEAPATKSSGEEEANEPELPPALVPDERRGPGVLSSLLWSVAILALTGTLLLQYAVHNRDLLARQEALRPWMEKLCAVADCTLPPRRDLSAIDLIDRRVQSHPRYEGALLISATLVNRANFTQPYPVVEVVLDDLNGQHIASRRFKPKEYLVENPGDGFRPGAEAHLLLEVADPGQDAMSFEFNFY